jgi:GDP-4-dehydro-6-deoxy-D-mannose reductase
MAQGPRTIVTGATGFAGRHLLDRLTGASSVVGWHRPGGRPPDPSRDIQWEPVDLIDRDAVARAVINTRPDRIYHLAGSPVVAPSLNNVVPYLRANALGTHHLLEAVRRAGRPCRVLVVSSAQIYQPSGQPLSEEAPLVPANPYGFSKLAADQLALGAVREDGLDVVLARPFNHTGPGQAATFAVPAFARQVALIEAGRMPPAIEVGDLTPRRDFTDVRDVVRAYWLALARAAPGVYNVCSGRSTEISEILAGLARHAGVELEQTTDPALLREHEVAEIRGSHRKLTAATGWEPEIPLERTLADTVQWWRERAVAAVTG